MKTSIVITVHPEPRLPLKIIKKMGFEYAGGLPAHVANEQLDVGPWKRRYTSPIVYNDASQAFWERAIFRMATKLNSISQWQRVGIYVGCESNYIVYVDKLVVAYEREKSWWIERTDIRKRHRVTGPAIRSTDDFKWEVNETYIINDRIFPNFSSLKTEADLTAYMAEVENGDIVVQHLVESGAVKVSDEFKENLRII